MIHSKIHFSFFYVWPGSQNTITRYQRLFLVLCGWSPRLNLILISWPNWANFFALHAHKKWDFIDWVLAICEREIGSNFLIFLNLLGMKLWEKSSFLPQAKKFNSAPDHFRVQNTTKPDLVWLISVVVKTFDYSKAFRDFLTLICDPAVKWIK